MCIRDRPNTFGLFESLRAFELWAISKTSEPYPGKTLWPQCIPISKGPFRNIGMGLCVPEDVYKRQLQADILELTANPDKPARGHIVEAKLDKGRGPVATVLIQEGTLHQGDTFVCGVFSGRVRAMFNDQGRKVKEAGPSIPVEVQGFEGVPEAGEEFKMCIRDRHEARYLIHAGHD